MMKQPIYKLVLLSDIGNRLQTCEYTCVIICFQANNMTTKFVEQHV